MEALYHNVSGYGNTASGRIALYNNITGNNNSAFGCNSGTISSSFSNTSAMGYNTQTTASDQVRIGTAVTSIGGPQNWTNTSDGRIKFDVKENIPGLKFISLLRPVTYNKSLKK